MARIHILHENEEWLPPLRAALDALGAPYEEWNLEIGMADLSGTPPEGVFMSRMSASAHTRGHRHAPDLAAAVVGWLELHDRPVFNGTRALALELSKVAQQIALERAGIATPRTIAAVGTAATVEAARRLGEAPLILKPNRGGKGAGVRLFQDADAVAGFLAEAPAEERPVDGVWLVQEYVRAAEPCITRCEFVDGRFLYAVRVDTSDGFELCPADACEIGTPAACTLPDGEKFRIIDGFDDPIVERYRAFLAANAVRIAGIELVRDTAGRIVTYDVNTNTNYNGAAEARAGVARTGPQAVAAALVRALEAERDRGLKRAS